MFFQDMAVATVYTNLGDEAVAHALNETQVKVVVTSHELLPKFKVMLEKLPEIRHVIVMEDQLHPTVTTGFKEGVAIHQFRSVVTRVRCVYPTYTACFLPAYIRSRLTKDSCNSSCCSCWDQVFMKFHHPKKFITIQ